VAGRAAGRGRPLCHAEEKEVQSMSKKPVKIVIRKLDRVETTRVTAPGDG
jgi:hypothetical protein